MDFRDIPGLSKGSTRHNGERLFHWREHDMTDKPEPIVVTLCQSCSSELIDSNPRLYVMEEINNG